MPTQTPLLDMYAPPTSSDYDKYSEGGLPATTTDDTKEKTWLETAVTGTAQLGSTYLGFLASQNAANVRARQAKENMMISTFIVVLVILFLVFRGKKKPSSSTKTA